MSSFPRRQLYHCCTASSHSRWSHASFEISPHLINSEKSSAIPALAPFHIMSGNCMFLLSRNKPLLLCSATDSDTLGPDSLQPLLLSADSSRRSSYLRVSPRNLREHAKRQLAWRSFLTVPVSPSAPHRPFLTRPTSKKTCQPISQHASSFCAAFVLHPKPQPPPHADVSLLCFFRTAVCSSAASFQPPSSPKATHVRHQQIQNSHVRHTRPSKSRPTHFSKTRATATKSLTPSSVLLSSTLELFQAPLSNSRPVPSPRLWQTLRNNIPPSQPCIPAPHHAPFFGDKSLLSSRISSPKRSCAIKPPS